MALTKNQKPEETQADVPTEEPKKTERKKADDIIVLEHPTVKGTASTSFYLTVNEEQVEKQIELKEGRYSMKNEKANYPLRDLLVSEGWIDHTYYSLQQEMPSQVPTMKPIVKWVFQHPDYSKNNIHNFTLGIYVGGVEHQIEVIDSRIETDHPGLAASLERERWNCIATEKAK